MTPVLLLAGPSAVGKSTVASELSWLLEDEAIAHAAIDWDQLTCCTPALGREASAEVLSRVWGVHREGGATRLLLVATLERADDLDLVRRAIPEAAIAIFRLTAPLETLLRRVAERERGGRGEARHRAMAERHAPILAAMSVPHRTVDTDERSPREIAEEIARQSGWTCQEASDAR